MRARVTKGTIGNGVMGRMWAKHDSLKHIRWRNEHRDAQGNRCYYCEVVMTRRAGPQQCTLDHKVPLARGGKDIKANCVAACYTCNQAKGDLTFAEIDKLLEGKNVELA